MVGLVVKMPFRSDRSFCIPLLWRIYEKGDPKQPKSAHRTKLHLAAEMVKIVAGWLENRNIVLVADSAYMGRTMLQSLPQNVHMVGPAA